MEDPLPDLYYYRRIARNKGISEDHLREELIDLYDEVKSFIGAMKIQQDRILNSTLDIKKG